MHLSAIIVCLACGIASAQAGEKISGAEIETALSDHTAWYTPLDATSARQYFHKNGSTPYITANGEKSYGEWAVRADKYCSLWPPSDHWTCFDVERATLPDGTPTLTFVSGGNGKRYEAVLKSGNHSDVAWSR
jgi:hypothetical protein